MDDKYFIVRVEAIEYTTAKYKIKASSFEEAEKLASQYYQTDDKEHEISYYTELDRLRIYDDES